VYLGKILDVTSQRDRAVNEYHQAQRTSDNTRGALDDVATYLQVPYPRPWFPGRKAAYCEKDPFRDWPIGGPPVRYPL